MRPRSMVRPLLLVAPLLVATIAATLVAVFSPEAPPRRAGAVDFDTGTLQGNGVVEWNAGDGPALELLLQQWWQHLRGQATFKTRLARESNERWALGVFLMTSGRR